jgi:hypothetical protein
MANTPKSTAPKTSRAAPQEAKPSATRSRRSAQRKPDATGGSRALSAGAAVLAIGAGIAGFLARRQIAAWATEGAAKISNEVSNLKTSIAANDTAEHAAPDLAVDKPHPTENDRAPLDFRPNMDAPMSDAEREALRPATGPAPSLVAEQGEMNSQTGASN